MSKQAKIAQKRLINIALETSALILQRSHFRETKKKEHGLNYSMIRHKNNKKKNLWLFA